LLFSFSFARDWNLDFSLTARSRTHALEENDVDMAAGQAVRVFSYGGGGFYEFISVVIYGGKLNRSRTLI
jgi:hypothetical protein